MSAWITSLLSVFLLSFFSSFSEEKKAHIHIYKNEAHLGENAALAFQALIKKTQDLNKKLIVVLPSCPGSAHFYHHLVTLWKEGSLDLSNVSTFSLNEYIGLDPSIKGLAIDFLNQNFYHLVSEQLTHEKLFSFGLKTLTIDDLSYNLLKRFSLDQINTAISHFRKLLIDEFNQIKDVIPYEECERIYWKILKTLKIKDEIFVQLDSHILNHKVLPTSRIILHGIHHDMTLRKHGLKQENIHFPKTSLSRFFDHEESVKNYKNSYQSYAQDPRNFTVFFLNIGEESPHIGYNNFSSEKEFQNTHLTKEEKNALALESSIRLVPIKDCESEFFSFYNDKAPPKKPSQRVVFGLKEILNANDIIVLAQGQHKQHSLYQTLSTQTPSYDIPSSYLNNAKNCYPCFYIDELAYGQNACSKKNLRSFYQKKIKDDFALINIYFHNTEAKTFFEIPTFNKPAITLNPHSETADTHVQLVSLPTQQKILFIKKNKKNNFHLIELLKLKQNIVREIFLKNPEILAKEIIQLKPDIIFFPSDVRKSKKLIPLLKKILKNNNYNQSLLGIYYSLRRKTHDAILPLTQEALTKKLDSLQKFHLSLINKSSYPLMAKYLAYYYPFTYLHKETPNENFEIYRLTKNNHYFFCKKLSKQIISFEDNGYIPKGYSSFEISESDKIIAVAPHPNDVEIAMGGFIHESYKKNISPIVINATTGHRAQLYQKTIKEPHSLSLECLKNSPNNEKNHKISNESYTTMVREFETMNALKFLNPMTTVENLKLPFYSKGIITKQDKDLAFQVLEKYLATENHRIFLFLPRQDDYHPTNQMTTELFYKSIKNFLSIYPDKEIYLAFYRTPWSGYWNLYHFNYHKGSKLAALVAEEIINRTEHNTLSMDNLGGNFAERFFVFYIINHHIPQ